MRFIADMSCDFGVVRTLRAAGHDVLAVAALARGRLADDVRAFVTANETALVRSFVTLTPGKARVSKLPVE